MPSRINIELDRVVVRPSSPIRLGIVFGTRPETIRLGPILRQARALSSSINITTFFSGEGTEKPLQHLKPFGVDGFKVMDLDPQIANRKPHDIISGLLAILPEHFKRHKLDMVAVIGDTNTALAASLAAYHHNIPIAHIEAGLDSRLSPGRLNRSTISIMSALSCAPSFRTARQLAQLGTGDVNNIFVTGSPLIDALKIAMSANRTRANNLPKDPFVLVNINRPENLGDPMKRILFAIKAFSERHERIKIIFPSAVSERTGRQIKAYFGQSETASVVAGAMSYRDFINFLSHSRMVITDSQGTLLQGYALGKNMLSIGGDVDYKEIFDSGQLVTVRPTSADEMSGAIEKTFALPKTQHLVRDEFGDGAASQRILASILSYFGLTQAGENRISKYVRVTSNRLPRVSSSFEWITPPRFKEVSNIHVRDCVPGSIRWLLNSGILDRSDNERNRGGIHAWFCQRHNRFSFMYPEITGYGLSTLAFTQREFCNPHVMDRAEEILNWLQNNVRGGNTDAPAGLPARIYARPLKTVSDYNFVYSFDTAMIGSGLMNMFSINRDRRYIDLATKMFQTVNGMYRPGKFFYAYHNPLTHRDETNPHSNWSTQSGTFHTKIAIMLLKCRMLTLANPDVPDPVNIAIDICNQALHHQAKNGRFFTNLGEPHGGPRTTHMHPHCYTAEGLLYTGLDLAKTHAALSEKYIAAAAAATEWMFHNQMPTGGIPQMYDGNVFCSYERTDVLAQALRLGCILHQQGKFTNIRGLEHLALRLTQFQERDRNNCRSFGGFRYGWNETGTRLCDINSWCTMFSLQALHMYRQLKEGRPIDIEFLA